MITILLTLIFVTLLVFGFLAFLAWQKVSLFLTWNTRYEQADYERTITIPKLKRPTKEVSRSEQRGRSIKPVDDLVDLVELPFDTIVKAIEEAGQ